MNFKEEYLNKKNSTRNLSDEEFDRLLPDMAEQLSCIDYHYVYDNNALRKSWQQLLDYTNPNNFSPSQVRPGVALCEHFFPNFYDIKDKKGRSFDSFWTPEHLQKILRWNRKSHTTPYLSELKRGIYFCYGLTKNTMYRPHLAKMICDKFKPTVVLDPCCGWGGRMLGVVASGAHYIGFEPNTKTYKHLLELAEYLDIQDKITIYNEGAENISKHSFSCDLIITSPPYYDLEVYSDEETQSINGYTTYNEWRDGWLKSVIQQSLDKLAPNGISCWNVGTSMIEDVANIHKELGYSEHDVFGLSSSARQANQNTLKNKKTVDLTICYKK